MQMMARKDRVSRVGEVRVRVRSSMAKGLKALSLLTFLSPYKLKGAGETIFV